MSRKILVVDDEKVIVEILKFNLRKEGFETIEAYDGEQAIKLALTEKPDLILLDLMLPGLDGYAVCLKLRETINTPIIMLTAKDEEIDKILGLELGADDFITKPFSSRELVARAKALLRRSVGSSMLEESDTVLKCGNLLLDMDNSSVRYFGEQLELLPEEFELVKLLASNRGRKYTREKLLENIWDKTSDRELTIVDLMVDNINRKFNTERNESKFIEWDTEAGYFIGKAGGKNTGK